MHPIYQHYKGRHYLELVTAAHSETLEPFVVYRCLYDNPAARTWIRPKQMFHGVLEDGTRRFTAVGHVRRASSVDERAVLVFGYETWGRGETLTDYLSELQGCRDFQRGNRFVLQNARGEVVSLVNVIRFERGLCGFGDLLTIPKERGKGYASLLLRAVMELERLEDPATRFLLCSEVSSRIFQELGFGVLPDDLQRFKPALVMVTGASPLTEREVRWVRECF